MLMAARAQARITKVHANHLSMFSPPGVVTKVITEAARAVREPRRLCLQCLRWPLGPPVTPKPRCTAPRLGGKSLARTTQPGPHEIIRGGAALIIGGEDRSALGGEGAGRSVCSVCALRATSDCCDMGIVPASLRPRLNPALSIAHTAPSALTESDERGNGSPRPGSVWF
jgi:hypothetical protein